MSCGRLEGSLLVYSYLLWLWLVSTSSQSDLVTQSLVECGRTSRHLPPLTPSRALRHSPQLSTTTSLSSRLLSALPQLLLLTALLSRKFFLVKPSSVLDLLDIFISTPILLFSLVVVIAEISVDNR